MNTTTSHSSLIRRTVAATALLGALAVPGLALASTPAAAAPAKSCKSVTANISYLNIAKVGSKQAKTALGCQQANAVGNTWMLRFKDHMQVQKFSVNFVSYRCKLVPTLPRNTLCLGGGTAVKFSAPTGG